MRYIFLVIANLISVTAYAQTGKLSGQLVDESDQPLAFANVILKGSSQGSVANEEGNFTIKGIKNGDYVLSISYSGFDVQELSVQVKGTTDLGRIQVNSATHELQEITIEGKSDNLLMREKPIQSVVIDAKTSSKQPSTMIELMNRSAGVRVRQTGGLGSGANLSLNGFRVEPLSTSEMESLWTIWDRAITFLWSQ